MFLLKEINKNSVYKNIVWHRRRRSKDTEVPISDVTDRPNTVRWKKPGARAHQGNGEASPETPRFRLPATDTAATSRSTASIIKPKLSSKPKPKSESNGKVSKREYFVSCPVHLFKLMPPRVLFSYHTLFFSDVLTSVRFARITS